MGFLGRAMAGIGAGALALGLGVGTAGAASAASSSGGEGLVRLAHLSPDTPAADVRVSSESSGGDVIELSGVAYGAVSDFVSVPAGTYEATMTQTEAGSGILTAPITVRAGEVITVAAVGRSGSVEAVVLNDDFSAPSAGNAKVRLIQASVNAPSVNVGVQDGPGIVEGARFGTGTGYAEVPARDWVVQATPVGGSATAGSADVSLAAGSIVTLLVLDNPDGSLAVRSVVDRAGSPAANGGVATGGGGLSAGTGEQGQALGVLAGGALVAGLLVLASLGMTSRRGR